MHTDASACSLIAVLSDAVSLLLAPGSGARPGEGGQRAPLERPLWRALRHGQAAGGTGSAGGEGCPSLRFLKAGLSFALFPTIPEALEFSG